MTVMITPEEIGRHDGRRQMALVAFSKLPAEIRRELGRLLGPRWNWSDICHFLPGDSSLWPKSVLKVWDEEDGPESVAMIVPSDPAAVMSYHAALRGMNVWNLRQVKEGKIVASLGEPVYADAEGKSALEAAFKLIAAMHREVTTRESVRRKRR